MFTAEWYRVSNTFVGLPAVKTGVVWIGTLVRTLAASR